MVAKFWHDNRHVGCSGIVYVTKQEKQATRKSVRQALVMVPSIQHKNLHTTCSSHVYVTKEDRTPRISGRQALDMVAEIWPTCLRVRCSGIVYVTKQDKTATRRSGPLAHRYIICYDFCCRSSAAVPTASQPHLTALRLHFSDRRIFGSFARRACRCRHM